MPGVREPPGTRVFQRHYVLETWLRESSRLSPRPPWGLLLSPVSFAHCWAIWATLSGSLGGRWLSPWTMLGGPPPPPSWGTGSYNQYQLLTPPCPWGWGAR